MRFCGQCAAALVTSDLSLVPSDSGPETGERRQLTVLFCDIVGSTRHAASMDPEAWRMVLRSYHGLCDEIVRPLNGHNSRAMGLLLQGKAIFADEIDTLGLATRIVEQGTALDYALDFAGHIAKQSPEVVRGIKALLRAGLERPYEEALQIERDIFPPLWAGDAHLRAVGKFLDKSREKKGNA
jgi:enoyl-CoA hydratase/carnithine racemase